MDSILENVKIGAGIEDTTVYDNQLTNLISATKSRLKIEGITPELDTSPLFPMYCEIIKFIVIPNLKENYKYSEDYRNNIFALKNELAVAQLVDRNNSIV